MASAGVLGPLPLWSDGPCDPCADGREDTPAVSGEEFKQGSLTLVLNYPWGLSSTSTLPLSEVPLLTARKIQQLSLAERRDGRRCALGGLLSSSELPTSLSGLYVPGSFLLSFAGGLAALPAEVAVQKLRLVLQGKEVHASSFVPLERLAGEAAAAAIAASKSDNKGGQGGSDAGAEEAWKPPLCSLWLLLRLPGGKGGFGALLKKQRRKRHANFSIDACRDLTGRRIRQAQVVTRIKTWMEKKRKEDALIAVLTQGNTEEKLPEAAPSVSLDASFISQQIAHVSEMPDLVARGLKQQMALREKREAEQKVRTAAPQNRALYAQLRDAVELDSDDDQWSDIEADEEPSSSDHEITSSDSASPSSSSSSSSSSRTRSALGGAAECSSSSTAAGPPSNSSDSNARSSSSSAGRNPSSKQSAGKAAKVDTAAQALMQQLEHMRLKAATQGAAERSKRAEEEAERARAAAAAEKAAAEAAERIAREARALDVSHFRSAEELAKEVDEAVVKEKLKQLGWKCGGRPEERAARLMHLKTVDLANVPKALLARQPARKA
ncbi:hypothetical protein ACSSS7_002100 [Eimeria intestinalis]